MGSMVTLELAPALGRVAVGVEEKEGEAVPVYVPPSGATLLLFAVDVACWGLQLSIHSARNNKQRLLL